GNGHRSAPSISTIGGFGEEHCGSRPGAVSKRTCHRAALPSDVNRAVHTNPEITKLVQLIRKCLLRIDWFTDPGLATVCRVRNPNLAILAGIDLGRGDVERILVRAGGVIIHLKPWHIGSVTELSTDDGHGNTPRDAIVGG